MWGDPGVTEQLQLQETPVSMPSTAGGAVTRTLQRSGFLKRLRMLSKLTVSQASGTGAPSKSPYGPLGSYLSRVRIDANGQIPLVDLSGLGATVYNEVQNRDGSPLARPLNIAELNVADSLKLAQYDAPGTAAQTYVVQYPFEYQFAVPVNIKGQVMELGLWLLQGQAIDVGITFTFNPGYATAATNDAAYSAGTAVVAVADLNNSNVQIERELYSIPNDPKDFPNLGWAHQIIEFTNSFTGNFSRFSIPRAGMIMRAIVINQDGSNNLVEYSDVKNMSWIYGSNETPISRPGWAYTHEYLHDYNRQPPKGTQVLDFYKWGAEGFKLVKSSEDLANLRIETTFTATASGIQRIILDRFIPVLSGR
jgi:hypothetical protein